MGLRSAEIQTVPQGGAASASCFWKWTEDLWLTEVMADSWAKDWRALLVVEVGHFWPVCKTESEKSDSGI